jgi:hypothetical protein
MTYLIGADLPTEPAGDRFRALLARPGILGIPGAHNGQAALQAKAAGFEALYLSGAAMTASMGLPDLGIITVDEVCFFIRQVARSSGLPVLVDGDTGYGEALNVMNMVSRLILSNVERKSTRIGVSASGSNQGKKISTHSTLLRRRKMVFATPLTTLQFRWFMKNWNK